MNPEDKQAPPSAKEEQSRLLLLELMKYRSMPNQAPKKLLDDIVALIDSSYKVLGLYGCGMEAFIIKVETLMVDERCLKIVFPSEGIEGQRTITFWETTNVFGRLRTNFQVKNEQISRTRFRQGAQIQQQVYRAIQEAKIDFFSVPEVYKVSDAPLYIEMDWVPSVPVLQWLHEQRDIIKALQCFCNLCRAVQFIHDRGIIHRDLKPDNMYIWKNLGVCILDWSIAKPIGDRNLTVSGLFLGAKPYISPVQAQDAKTATHLDDIHYLGYTFAAFVFDKDLPVVLDSKKDYARLLVKYRQKIADDIPEAMRAIFLKASELDEAARYQTADEMREDVEKIIASFSHHRDVFIDQSVSTPTPQPVANPLNDQTAVAETPQEEITPPQPIMSELDIKVLARFLSDQMVKDCVKFNLGKGMRSECDAENCDLCKHLNESLIITICRVLITMKQWRYL